MLVCCLSVLISGCSLFDFFSAENLLKPPKLTGEKAQLQVAFEQTVGTDVSLYTPIAGEHRGSYILFDGNADGNDEAIVFYSFNSNSSVIHMHLLSLIDGEWQSIGDITGSGTEVYKVDFRNIDSSRNLEISVVWSLDDSKREKTLCIYRFELNTPDSLVSLASIQMSDFIFADVDGDNANELLYFYFNNTKDFTVTARLIDYNLQESNFVPLSEVSLPFSFTQIVQVHSDKEDNNYRFYIDCISPNSEIFTEVIVYSSVSAVLFIPTVNDENISSRSVRDADVLCRDFNNDGYYDVPVMLNYSESYTISETESELDGVAFVEWYTFLDKEFISIGKYFINEYDGFALKIDSFYDYYYIVYDYANKVTQIRIKNMSEESNLVATISYADSSSDSLIIIPDGFLSEKDAKEFSVVLSAKGESLGFTENFVRSLISKL